MCLGIPGQVDRAAREARAPRAGRRERRRPGHQHRPARGRAPRARRLGAHPRRLRDVEDRRGRGAAGTRGAPADGRASRRAAGARVLEDHRRGRGCSLMRFVDEYRDPAAARALVARITELAGDDHFKFMEVCGGHTHTIYRHGIEHVLPRHGRAGARPGCPVCVIPMGRVDDAIAVAETPGVIFTSFGDMMRVPGEHAATCSRPRRAAPTCASCTRRSTRLRLAVENARPRRRVLRGRVRDHRAVHRVDAAARHASSGVTNFRGVLQPRDDRAADQGHPRVARPAPRRLPRARARVDGRRATGPTASCPSSTASRS